MIRRHRFLPIVTDGDGCRDQTLLAHGQAGHRRDDTDGELDPPWRSEPDQLDGDERCRDCCDDDSDADPTLGEAVHGSDSVVDGAPEVVDVVDGTVVVDSGLTVAGGDVVVEVDDVVALSLVVVVLVGSASVAGGEVTRGATVVDVATSGGLGELGSSSDQNAPPITDATAAMTAATVAPTPVAFIGSRPEHSR